MQGVGILLNIPNCLSVFRLCLVPVFVLSYFSELPNSRLIAATVYAVATLTDYLDGYIARKYNLITNLGRILDPLGDKLLTFSALLCITIDRVIPFWALAVFFIKEALMGLGGMLIQYRARVDMPSSNYLGKAATVLFFVVCIALLIFDEISQKVAVVMVSAALLVSLAALISYYSSFRVIMAKKNKAE
jgi:cardiolipin synthase